MSEINSQKKHGMLMLAVSLFAITAVGVSTAQVVSALSSETLGNANLNPASAVSSDISVTIGGIPESENKMLVVKNLNDEELTIHHLDSANLNSGASGHNAEFCHDHSESVTLQPRQAVSVLINGPASSEYLNGDRTVSMKGLVIDGHMLLTGS